MNANPFQNTFPRFPGRSKFWYLWIPHQTSSISLLRTQLIFYFVLEFFVSIIPFLLSTEKHFGNYNSSLFLFTKIVFIYYTVKTCGELKNTVYPNYAVPSNQYPQLKMCLSFTASLRARTKITIWKLLKVYVNNSSFVIQKCLHKMAKKNPH